MTIAVGDRIPETTLFAVGEIGPEPVSTSALFAGRKVVVVGMPGAFTPTCHNSHLPGFIGDVDAFRAKGIAEVLVVTTNDAFVLGAWAKQSGSADGIRFLSDGNAEFVRAAGLDLDASARGLGVRAKRFAMVVDDGKVTWLSVEASPGEVSRSAANDVLAAL